MAVEGEVGAQDVLAQQTGFLGLPDGDAQAVDRDGILRAHVEVAVLRADGVARDHHALDDSQGVAFEDGAVHERAGVALVAVADHVFLIALGVVGELPLPAGGEARAAAAANAGGQHFVDDFLAAHAQRALQALERAHAQRFVDVLGVDDAAAVQGHAALLLVEVDVVLLGDLLAGAGLHVQQALHDGAAADVGVDDLFDVFDLHQAIQGILGIDLHEGTLGAEAEAAHQVHGDLVGHALGGQDFVELLGDLPGMVGETAGTAAKDDMPLAVRAAQLVLQVLSTRGNILIEFFDRIDHAVAPSFV